MKTRLLIVLVMAAALLVSGCDILKNLGQGAASDTTAASTQAAEPTPQAEATPTPEPEPTDTPAPAPTTQPVGITVDREHRETENSAYRADVYLPVFTVTGSDALQALLDDEVRGGVEGVLEAFTQWAQANPPIPPAGLNDLSFDFQVTRNDGRYLSLYGVVSGYMGGASVGSFAFAYTVDVAAVRLLTLEDILPPADRPLTNELIKAALLLNYGELPDQWDLFASGPPSEFGDGVHPHFYLTPDAMGFLFDKYTIYPGAFGVAQAEVPLADLPGPLGGGAAQVRDALCTAFNPAIGQITLDYVDILTGEAAVTALMADEGLTRAQAEERIYDHDPNEYIRNQNPQLRTFTVDGDTALYFINKADGTVNPSGYVCNYAALTSLYAARPAAVVSEYQLYHVVVSGSRVIFLRQTYRP